MKLCRLFILLLFFASNTLRGEDSAVPTSPASPIATWTSVDGRTIQARKLRLEGDYVVLERSDGIVFTVPLSRLSPESQRMAKGESVESVEGRENSLAPNQTSQLPNPETDPGSLLAGRAAETSVPERGASTPEAVQTEQAPSSDSPTNSPASNQPATQPQLDGSIDPPLQTTQTGDSTPQQTKSPKIKWWSERDTIVRISILTILLILASGIGGLAVRLIATGVFFGLLNVVSWLPSDSTIFTQFTVTFAVVSFLASIGRLGSSIRLVLASAVIFGLPTLLISHYLCSQSWGMAIIDAATVVALFPIALIHTLVRTGVIVLPPEPAPTPIHVNQYSSNSSFSSGAPDPPRRSEMRNR